MKNFRLLTVAGGLAYIAAGISSPLMTLFLESLGASFTMISLVLTSFMVVLLAFSYLWGRLSDRIQRRKPFVVGGLLGLAAAYALLGWAPTLAGAWWTRLIEGVAYAAYSTLSIAMVGDALALQIEAGAANRQGRQMGLYRGLGSLAFAAGSVGGGRLADAYSLAATFLACALAFLAAAVVAIFLADRPAGYPTEQKPLATQAAKPAALLPLAFLAGAFLWTAAHAASASMWPNYMVHLGYSKTMLTSLWGLAALVEMPAMMVLGAASDVLGRTVLLTAGGAGIALVNLGYATLAASVPALVGIQVVRGVGYSAFTGSALTYTNERGGRARGGASGLYHTTTSAGQLLGLLMGGTLVQRAGFPILFTTCAALALAATGCFWLLHQRAKPIRTALDGLAVEGKP
jgi:MFS family permease